VREAVRLFATAQVSMAGHPDEAKRAVERAGRAMAAATSPIA
jgi:hypothetical protein